jgi:hypothetical protein
MLSVIRSVGHSQSIEIWPERDAEALTEKSHCARKLREFIKKRGMAPPSLLEDPITGTGGACRYQRLRAEVLSHSRGLNSLGAWKINSRR